MSEPKNKPYTRTYIIEYKDGTTQRINGLDISIPAAGKIHSPSTQEVLTNAYFLAFRTQENRDTILIAVDTIKSIQILDRCVDIPDNSY